MGRVPSAPRWPLICRKFDFSVIPIPIGIRISQKKIMDLQLSGKLALVTGSTAGIGFAIAKMLAGEGARVIVNGRTETRVTDAVRQILEAHPKAQLESAALDLAKAETVPDLIARFPEVDILINNLGVYEPKPFEEISDDDWRAVIETNFMSGVRLCRHYLPKMRAKNWGRIQFISSESAVNSPVEMIHYGVTKTMQVALARGLAETTAGTGVTVNSVLVGPTWSEGVEQFVKDVARSKNLTPKEVEKDFFNSVRPSSLLKRFETADEVAVMVTYLSSPLAIGTNGAAVRVEGGVIRSIL
jgi:NAD(P)-dependent dehydrogenase (short-subunit alcohol dehydrogenase family)